MVINININIIKHKFYKILCIFIKFYSQLSYSYAYSLFVNIFYVRTLGSGKTFFIRYLTEYYMLLKKKVILTTIGCATSRPSSKTSTIHNTFHIQCKGYVWPLQELSVEFQILKELTSSLLMKCQWWQGHCCKTLKLDYGKLRMI
jgi:hypothetical protein